MYNNIKLLKVLIKMDCKIDFIDSEGFTILYNPIKHGYNDIVTILLTNTNIVGIPLSDFQDKYGSLPINYSISFENEDAFNILIKETNQFNKLDSKGLTTLHYAIKKKNYNVINKLIQNESVNINIQSNIGETPLHFACNYEDIKAVELLLSKKNINVNIYDYEHQITPLMYIVTLNNIDITRLLLNHKANPDLQDAIGNTSLHLEIIENNIAIANLLISKFTNFNLSDINSMTPLHQLLIVTNMNYNKIQQYNIDQLLNGTNLNIQDLDGNTIWHLLAKSGLWYQFKTILRFKKNNLFIKNSQNVTPYDILKNSKHYDELLNIIIESYYNLLLTKNDL